MSNYYSVTETAKLIRKALKLAWPHTKFSVRSSKYAGGASINVSWTDGPKQSDVDAYLKGYDGKGFDGMIDMSYYKESWLLPDGRAVIWKSEGTTDSAGTRSPYQTIKPHPEAIKASFGSNYVFTRREISEQYANRAETLWNKTPVERQCELINSFRCRWYHETNSESADYGMMVATNCGVAIQDSAKLPQPRHLEIS